MLQKNGFPSINIPEEIFEDDNLYVPQYSQTNTNTQVNEAPNKNTEPHTQLYKHLILQPAPQRKQKETAQALNSTPETKRKHSSPHTTNKKHQKDPLLPNPEQSRRERGDTHSRRAHDDAVLSENIMSSSEDEAPPASLPPLEGATALLPSRGERLGGRSIGNWTVDSQDLGPASSMESIPDSVPSGVRPRSGSGSRFREQVTPLKIGSNRMELR